MYFDADDPSQCLAPDAFVRRGASTELVRTWKVWERGAPEVAVEIVSDSDSADAPWSVKLSRYRRLGVSELVRFDPTRPERPLRIWDRVRGALLERELSGNSARSLILPIEWLVTTADDLPCALRIKRDGSLVPTDREASALQQQALRAAQQEREAERRAKDAERHAKDAERRAKDAAEARVKELEAELRRRQR